MNLKKMSDKKLIKDLNSLHQSIYVMDCYSPKDIVNYELITGELWRRGIEIMEESSLMFCKNGKKI